MPINPEDKAGMTVQIDRHLVDFVTRLAKQQGVSRNVLLSEIIAREEALHALGFHWFRDRRLGFARLRQEEDKKGNLVTIAHFSDGREELLDVS